ncbi:hypothetical protein Goklo_029705 [Gossypium klotzschianum]|uniref:DUF4283 domain-containing protein n=1 Tax=Gossypium klotzschianum TaxID=34286 RepID=A0A7J8W9K3_9ROSI|nr:hypothetical protein [Gossypium klotzschianum]
MEDAMENLNLLDEEEEAFQENKGAVGCVHQLYLVGRCRDSVVHFPSLCNTMADLWHPLGGICITEIGEKRYLFQFFHKVDIDRVVAEGRRRNMAVSRWLREADGSTYSEENLAGVMHGNPLNVGKGLSRNSRGSGGILNPNLIHVGTVQIQGGGRTVKGRTGCMNALNANGEMDLDLDEENKPIKLFDGQKRQRIVESSRVLIEENVGSRSINVSASSDD